MMRKVFNDKMLDHHFQKNGYVTFQLLDTVEIEALTRIYTDTLVDAPDGFFTTVGSGTAIKLSLQQRFQSHFFRLWSSVLYDYKPVSCNFITKKSAVSMDYHQDWSFIDESTGKCSLSFWCPLVDTFHENGNLAVIPGSHHLKHQLRTSNHHYSPYDPYHAYINELGIELPAAAGEAIIFDNALMHGSTANLSGTNRLIASMLLIPKEEQIVIQHISADKKCISMYKVSDDYLLQHNPFTEIPEERFLYKVVPFVPPVHPLDELKQLDTRLHKAITANKAGKGFFKKLMKSFT